MSMAQIAFCILTVGFLVAALVLIVAEITVMAWACFIVAAFGFLIFAAMLANDARSS